MRSLGVVLLGCALHLSATSSADNRGNQRGISESVEDTVDNTRKLAEERGNAVVFELPDGGLTRKIGCEHHKKGDQWGSSDHDNCMCEGPDRFCYRVDCLPGSEIALDSNGLWKCKVGSDGRDVAESPNGVKALQMFDAGKGTIYDYMDIMLAPDVSSQTPPSLTNVLEGKSPSEERSIPASLTAVAQIANAVFGAGSFIYGIDNGEQRLAELREINQKLDRLDSRLDALQQQIGDLQFGQQWLQGTFLYGRDIQRLNFLLDCLDNNLNLGSDGQLVPADQAALWADAVLDLDSDGVGQVLLNLHAMMVGTFGIFGRNSLFVLYESSLTRDSESYWSKVTQFLEFTFSIQTAGYASWATALNLKGRQNEVVGVLARGRDRLNSQRQFLQPFTMQWPTGIYGLPRTDTGCPVTAGARWRPGFRYHDTEDTAGNNDWIDDLHFDGDFGNNNMKQKFCMKTNAEEGDGSWPRGNYCIFKKGGCPGGFWWGKLKWDDEDTSNGNIVSGVLPDGMYNRDTEIEYCCRSDGSANTEIALPTLKPFYLFRYTSGCQKVKDMSVREEWFWWDDENFRNANENHGSHPYDDGGRKNHRVHYCYYT